MEEAVFQKEPNSSVCVQKDFKGRHARKQVCRHLVLSLIDEICFVQLCSQFVDLVVLSHHFVADSFTFSVIMIMDPALTLRIFTILLHSFH